jgi:hypothetical protein
MYHVLRGVLDFKNGSGYPNVNCEDASINRRIYYRVDYFFCCYAAS